MNPETSSPRLNQLLREAGERVDPADARLLLAHALGKSQAWLYAHGEDCAGPGLPAHFEDLLQARLAGEPVAYLLGKRGFWTLDLAVTPDTLIPRPETELLVQLALQRLPATGQLEAADLGTGSGAIALALAVERPDARIVATDASAGALTVARANAAQHGLDNVRFAQGDWFGPLHGQRFHLIASNPPYIAEGDPHLQRGDLRFEPVAALASGQDGLHAIRRIAAAAPEHLYEGGWLLLEHGWDQGPAVRGILAAAGFDHIATEQDLEARDRVTLGRCLRTRTVADTLAG